MDIGFLISYIIVPIVALLWLMRKRSGSVGRFLLFRGCFYFYLALANLVGYIKNENGMSAIVGYTIALAIMEGGYNLFDGIEKLKEHYKKDVDVSE